LKIRHILTENRYCEGNYAVFLFFADCDTTNTKASDLSV